MRIPFDQLKSEFKRVLTAAGFTEVKAEKCAAIFAENSRDGIYSHGLNRFPLFIDYIRQGVIDITADPVVTETFGAIECWDGNYGPGMLNASFCMDRAISLAKANGIGCVALRNTNHWMRGGTYGLQAAEAGCISISFSNTIANMPPWGGKDPRLGNNPLVIAVPYQEGTVLLDMAMSQYSYGKMSQERAAQRDLPYDGGFDAAGDLTKDPAAILATQRALPIGLWKGSGLSLVLDLLATVLSKGRSTGVISEGKSESGVSQVFICIYREDNAVHEELISDILAYTRSSEPVEANGTIAYPGERMLETRRKNMDEGIPVDETIWQQVQNL